MTHSQRDHATWSASATARNVACPGALNLILTLPATRKSSQAAAYGTACHQISERCLKTDKNPEKFLDTVELADGYEFTVDEEMAETCQSYVDYVRERAAAGKLVGIEQNFTLSVFNPPFDAGGTADAVVHFPAEKLIEIIDLKAGRGVVVEAAGNAQLRTYALGALVANPGLDVQWVKSTIVQPRAPHKDGRIRSETIHAADLIDWTTDLLAAMQRSADPQAPLHAGDHCQFCPAAGVCPELRNRAYEKANLLFDDMTGAVHIPNKPAEMQSEEIERLLDAADMLQEHINAVRAYAHEQAESGVEFENYVLVPKQARRKWRDDMAAQAAWNECVHLDIHAINFAKIKTPAQIEKIVGKEKWPMFSRLISAESSGTNLVRKDKTTKKAVEPMVNRLFDVL